MFSKSPKVGSPAEGEMSIPRAKGASEAVTVTESVRASDAGCVAAPDTATVQEVHLVAIHALCAALDAEVAKVTRW